MANSEQIHPRRQYAAYTSVKNAKSIKRFYCTRKLGQDNAETELP